MRMQDFFCALVIGLAGLGIRGSVLDVGLFYVIDIVVGGLRTYWALDFFVINIAIGDFKDTSGS